MTTPYLRPGQTWVNPRIGQVVTGVWDGLQEWDDEDREDDDPSEDSDVDEDSDPGEDADNCGV